MLSVDPALHRSLRHWPSNPTDWLWTCERSPDPFLSQLVRFLISIKIPVPRCPPRSHCVKTGHSTECLVVFPCQVFLKIVLTYIVSQFYACLICFRSIQATSWMSECSNMSQTLTCPVVCRKRNIRGCDGGVWRWFHSGSGSQRESLGLGQQSSRSGELRNCVK